MAGAGEEIRIRRRRDADLPAVAAIRNMEKVRWGTLQVPFTSVLHTRSRLKAFPDEVVSLVAWRGERVVGEVSLIRRTAPRLAHSASFGIMVADDAQGTGVGTALLGALIELADNWLG